MRPQDETSKTGGPWFEPFHGPILSKSKEPLPAAVIKYQASFKNHAHAVLMETI
jgi:hypothetical protein